MELNSVLRYFHGGEFVIDRKEWQYRNAECEKFAVDYDLICVGDLKKNVEELGYSDKPYLYYRVPGVIFNGDALVLVHDDSSVNAISNILKGKGTCDLYVDHTKCEAEQKKNAQNVIVIEDTDVQVIEVETLSTTEEAIENLPNLENEALFEAGEANENLPNLENEAEFEAGDYYDVQIELENHGGVVGIDEEAVEVEQRQIDEREATGFLYNVEVCSDIDDEVEEIRAKAESIGFSPERGIPAGATGTVSRGKHSMDFNLNPISVSFAGIRCSVRRGKHLSVSWEVNIIDFKS